MSRKGPIKKMTKVNRRDEQYIQDQDFQATAEGPSKKKWTKHDLLQIQPKTPRQKDMFQCFYQDGHLCVYGSAGTGKTFLSTYLALNDILAPDRRQHNIKFVRSIVPTRDIGFLPGSLDEKVEVYETPYRDIMAELCGRASTYDDMKKAKLIQFIPTSFIRGTTWDNSIIILDEVQNMTFHEISSIMTRVGYNSRVIVTGDIRQTDLNKNSREKSGMQDFLKISRKMNCFSHVEFNHEDIVRSAFVKEWIIASEDYECHEK